MYQLFFNSTLGGAPPEGLTNTSELLTSVGHCWFARETAAISGNNTFIGIVHNDGGGYSQNIIQLDASGNSSVNKVGTVTEYDDHNEPSILIKSDGKIFTSYAEHGGDYVRYRNSTNVGDATAWGSETALDPGYGDYTYPSCFEDASGNIWLFFRDDELAVSERGWSLLKSTNNGSTFSGYLEFAFGRDNKGYLIPSQDPDNKDIIHFVMSYTHPVEALNNSIYHFYFDCSAETWHKSDGTDVTANLPIDTSTDSTVIKAVTLPDTAWIEDIVVVDGKPRVLITFLPDAKNNDYLIKDLYYSEWNGTAWTTPHRIHTAIEGYVEDDSPTLESPMYPTVATFHRAYPDRIIASKRIDGVAELFEIKKVDYNVFSSTQLTTGSTYDQWRPFTSKGLKNNLFWLNKTEYNHWFNDFNQQLWKGTYYPTTFGSPSIARITKETDNYFVSSNNSDLNISGDLSISFWIYPNESPTTTHYHILGKRSDIAGNQIEYSFGFINDPLEFRWLVYDGSVVSATYSAVSMEKGQWYHVYGHYNSSDKKAYVSVNNETLIGSSTALTGTPNTGLTKFYVGAGNDTGTLKVIDAIFDECGVWNRLLTAAERTWLYAGNKYADIGSGDGAALATSLASWYKFNELTGNALDSHGSIDLTEVGTCPSIEGI